MGPAERCVDFGPSGQLWFPYLAKYAGFTHPILFCISVADCLLGNKPLGKKAQYHLGETLVFINQRLSDNTTALHDSTIFVVLALIDFSAYLRDYKTAMVHLKGLGEMVRLRGGIDNFRYLPRLYTKLGRLDLIQALYSGNKPVFLVDTTSCPRISEDVDFWSAHGGTSLPQSAGNLGLKNEVLLAAFTDLRQLSEVLNTKTASCRRLDVAVFQARVCSIQYRLLWLQGTLDDCLAECLRLAMLAFLATTFHVPLAVAQYPYLANHYRESCAAMGARNLENLPLWFLMVGALSVFGVEDAWLQERWRAEVPPQLAWDEARLQLRDIMWIDTIHNQPGERVFQILKCGRVEGAHRSTSRSKLWVGGWVGTTYELY
ncbi:hypothetical protein B0H67DRAFT_484487 [Lasiosphaeris hirsuta]|uniref:Uncharacterized protein n=1 Tax=Lasiosphaeris hirsuta TaxID=260670 RepID=A0AA40ASF8_9PEZI|nr:hypothetical protein B0H67DRAFT_484487 [Lasiosphaeris hirsuta]